MTHYALSPVRLYLDGQLLGAATITDLPMSPIPVGELKPFNLGSCSFEETIALYKSQRRQLKELLNPGLKDFHFWAKVKRAQERRQMARRKQGRS
jgi:hypothetical protein